MARGRAELYMSCCVHCTTVLCVCWSHVCVLCCESIRVVRVVYVVREQEQETERSIKKWNTNNTQKLAS